MKLSLRDLFWLVLVAAVLFAWWERERYLAAKSLELENEVGRMKLEAEIARLQQSFRTTPTSGSGGGPLHW